MCPLILSQRTDKHDKQQLAHLRTKLKLKINLGEGGKIKQKINRQSKYFWCHCQGKARLKMLNPVRRFGQAVKSRVGPF